MANTVKLPLNYERDDDHNYYEITNCCALFLSVCHAPPFFSVTLHLKLFQQNLQIFSNK